MVSMKTSRIKFRGVFDFDKLYKTIYAWLQKNFYLIEEDMFKYKPPKKVQVKMHGSLKFNGYIFNQVRIAITSREFTPIEVVKDGKKKEMIDGRIIIETTLVRKTDYEGLWSKSPIKERMKKLMEKFVINERLDTLHDDPLYYKIRELNEKIKDVLQMDTRKGLSYGRPFSYDEDEMK